MRILSKILSLWRNFLQKRRIDDDLNDEVHSYIEMLTERRVQNGESHEEARRQALIELGGAEQVKEKVREKRIGHFLETILQDLRYGIRVLAKSPVFTAVTVLTLALGIGANTAIFSLIDAVLLKTLPVKQPEQLFFVNNVGRQGGGGAPPYPCFELFRDHNHFLSGIAAFTSLGQAKIKIDGHLEEANTQIVSGSYFSLLGVEPVIGRTFTASDDSVIGKGGPDGPVAVIGYEYWKRRFNGDPSVIGKSIQNDSQTITIIGVSQQGFHGMTPGREVDISIPMMLGGPDLSESGSWWFSAVARIKPGTSTEQARVELDSIFQGYMDKLGETQSLRQDYFDHIEFTPAGRGKDSLRRDYSEPLRILMIVVVLVLLIACANVANLLLARSNARRKEFAVRLSLGASRRRLIRQIITESLLLVGLGGLFGVVLAQWCDGLLLSLMSTGESEIKLDLNVDGRLLLFAFGLSLLTGLIFSAAPALQSTRVDLGPELKQTTTSAAHRRSRMLLGKGLVVIQVALSLVLLVGAGLFLRTLQNMKSFDAGFRPQGVLTMRLEPASNDALPTQSVVMNREILTRVQSLPGIVTASFSSLTPMDGRKRGVMVTIPGFIPPADRDTVVTLNHISSDYFKTLGIRLLQGRQFSEADTETAPKVCMLNQSAATFYFGNKNPIGAMVSFSRPHKPQPYEVVGVVKDVKQYSLREDIPRTVYIPLSQKVDQAVVPTLSLVTNGNPSNFIIPVQNEIKAIAPDILVTNVFTLDQRLNQTLILERLVASLANVFGLLALSLTCIGLFGVMSYEVSRRTHEIGIRLAIGARPGEVVRMVMRETVLLVVIGAAIGLGISLITGRYISSLLFGLAPNDPLTIAIAVLSSCTIATLAGYIPARKASRVDPMVALRYE